MHYFAADPFFVSTEENLSNGESCRVNAEISRHLELFFPTNDIEYKYFLAASTDQGVTPELPDTGIYPDFLTYLGDYQERDGTKPNVTAARCVISRYDL